jgi:hypothetical protein
LRLAPGFLFPHNLLFFFLSFLAQQSFRLWCSFFNSFCPSRPWKNVLCFVLVGVGISVAFHLCCLSLHSRSCLVSVLCRFVLNRY